MGLWNALSRIAGRTQRTPNPLPVAPLYFKSPDAALQFACTIAPPPREGLAAPAVIDDVDEIPGFGPVAKIRVATPTGPSDAIAVFPERDDVIGACVRISDLCAVQYGPEPTQAGEPRALMIVAILEPEFRPADMQWAERKRLGGGKGN